MELVRLLGVLLVLLLPYVSSYRDRIIGGRECCEDEHPWLALLYSLTVPYCAGVLIDLNWVVTAAHCCKNSDIVVRLGEHDLEVSSGHEQMRISKNTFLFNPKGDCESECKEDIMLIQLNEPAVRTDWVAPVNWATICPDVETICTVMGWGAITSPDETFPTVPHCVNITIFETKLCQDEFPCIVPENILCAGDLEGGRDSCRGDSGGPLICDNTLHGIVSLGGNPCGQPNMPAVYTKICKYADWIQQHLSQSRS
ncbi:alpha- and beta-fibrinogenase OhS1-like isoform X2 [Sphaerodactylus townsendi]|uniref:alpha- and beta-fibrinogenase OhS1-like isoform X2 n=1 Tax=Sphaerodactylus townsendi TaxID=933632 RepID=UPI0020272BD2|nr:alpha- and beta-fibrinogenase OhS1-like isoform X2 [Sphaerodactylus townsendi]